MKSTLSLVTALAFVLSSNFAQAQTIPAGELPASAKMAQPTPPKLKQISSKATKKNHKKAKSHKAKKSHKKAGMKSAELSVKK